jgi:hypothetical protein
MTEKLSQASPTVAVEDGCEFQLAEYELPPRVSLGDTLIDRGLGVVTPSPEAVTLAVSAQYSIIETVALPSENDTVVPVRKSAPLAFGMVLLGELLAPSNVIVWSPV